MKVLCDAWWTTRWECESVIDIESQYVDFLNDDFLGKGKVDRNLNLFETIESNKGTLNPN